MIHNPEFRRNVWTELTPNRITMLVIFLAAIFGLASVTGGETAVGGAAASIFVLLTTMWGSQLAARSLVHETNNRTWDFQRMSSIGPWQMAWGKLFGSTVFPWFGGAICLIIYLVCTPFAANDAIVWAQLMVASAILLQSVSFLISLMILHKREDGTQARRSAPSLVLLLVLVLFFGVAIFRAVPMLANRGEVMVPWHGFEMRASRFVLSSVWIFAGWGLVGTYRVMRRELQIRNAPWVWAGFVLFVMVYATGLVNMVELVTDELDVRPGDDTLLSGIRFAQLVVAAGAAAGLSYLAGFFEEKNLVNFRRWFAALRERRWGAWLQMVPAWVLSLFFAFVALAGALLFPTTAFPDIVDDVRKVKVILAAGGVFILRDFALLLLLNFTLRPKHADATIAVSLLLLYGLFPAILTASEATVLLPLFWPSWEGEWARAIAPPAAELAILLAVGRRQWSRILSPRAVDEAA